jgi:predicted SprT family Zn-dependent metalloprotease
MDRIEMVQVALQELGDVANEKLATFVQKRFGVRIESRYMPLYRASIRDKQRLEAGRQAARGVIKVKAVRGNWEIGSPTLRACYARELALDLMADHGLRSWSFAFNRRKEATGLCDFRRRTIELSIYFVERNPPLEIRDTILHEIAHALVGPGHGHDEIWKRKCIAIGARPERTGAADMPPGRWQARCGRCGMEFHRHRRPQRLRGWFCRTCGPKQGTLVWREDAAA